MHLLTHAAILLLTTYIVVGMVLANLQAHSKFLARFNPIGEMFWWLIAMLKKINITKYLKESYKHSFT